MKSYLVGSIVLALVTGCGSAVEGGSEDDMSTTGPVAASGETEGESASAAPPPQGEGLTPLPDESPVGATPPDESASKAGDPAPEIEGDTAETTALLETCFKWNGQNEINKAIANHDCVAVAPGSYPLTKPIRLLAGHTLIGESNNRSAAVFYAAPGFTGSQILTDDLSNGVVATVRRLSFDVKMRASGVGARKLTARNIEVHNARCWGVGIAGYGFRLENSNIHHNGADPTCNAAPGGGIYITRSGDVPDAFAPVISGNSIHDNTGPGLDIAGVWGGKLFGNDIRNNSHWAAVSLFGANWEIYDNRIYHPTRNKVGIPDGQPYWSECRGGPNGVHPAAIMLCLRTDAGGSRASGNYIHDNSMASYYGVQLIGADESKPYIAPRNNRVLNNNLTGSVNACVDDFRPGQWQSDKNTWSGCTPQYF